MTDLLGRWPTWYWLLAAYTASRSFSSIRQYARVAASIRETEARTADANARRELQGQRVGGWVRAVAWLVSGLLLLTGWNWVRLTLAAAYARLGFVTFRDYAIGFAEGRKAASLAAAPEYVHGRVPPRPVDFLVSGALVGITRGVPLAAVLYAIARLPGDGPPWAQLGRALLWFIGAVLLIVVFLLLWVSLTSRPAREPVRSVEHARQLLERLVNRGTNLATVEFFVRGRPAERLRFTKHLSGEVKRTWVFKTFSPDAEIRIVSTLIEPKGGAAKFQELIGGLESAGVRIAPPPPSRRRTVLTLDYGRNVASALAFLEVVFARVFEADLTRDVDAVIDKILDQDAPQLTGVGGKGGEKVESSHG